MTFPIIWWGEVEDEEGRRTRATDPPRPLPQTSSDSHFSEPASSPSKTSQSCLTPARPVLQGPGWIHRPCRGAASAVWCRWRRPGLHSTPHELLCVSQRTPSASCVPPYLHSHEPHNTRNTSRALRSVSTEAHRLRRLDERESLPLLRVRQGGDLVSSRKTCCPEAGL